MPAAHDTRSPNSTRAIPRLLRLKNFKTLDMVTSHAENVASNVELVRDYSLYSREAQRMEVLRLD